MDEYSLAIRNLDEFLSSELETVSITDETYIPQANGPVATTASHLDEDNTLSSFGTMPKVVNSTTVQTYEAGPLKIIPIEDNCFATEEMNIRFNISGYSTTNTVLPSTGESQSAPVINYCSPQLPVTYQIEESTSYKSINYIPPQFQIGQQRQQGYARIIQPNINTLTLPHQWPSDSSHISNVSPDDTFIADLMTMPTSSSSVIQANCQQATTFKDHLLQNTANSFKLVSGTSLETGVQVNSIQTIDSLGQQNTSLTVQKPSKYDVTKDYKTFKRPQISKERNNLDTAYKPFECNVCHEKFRWKSRLDDHYFIHTSEKSLECNICHKKFKRKNDLNKHHVTHIDEKPFECSVCHKKFKWVSNLNSHYLIHADEKPFECNVCHKKCRSKGNLNKHHITHTDEKPFECNVCHKKCRTKDNLNKHHITHTDEKPFKCNLCPRKFKSEGSLKTHYLIHTGGATI